MGIGSKLKRGILATYLLCLWPLIAVAELSKPRDLNETMEWMAEALRALEPVDRVTIDRDGERILLQLNTADQPGDDTVVYPHNMHDTLTYLTDPNERQEVFDFRIQAVFDYAVSGSLEYTAKDLHRIYPVLRHNSLQTTYVADDGTTTHLLVGDAIGDANIFYVMDSDKSVSYLSAEILPELGLNEQKLKEIARGNLIRKAEDLNIDGDGIYFLELDGFYESSFVLHSPLWREIDAQIEQVLMAFPTRDLVVFSDGTNPAALGVMRDIVKEFNQTAPYPLSDLVFSWEGDGWQVVE